MNKAAEKYLRDQSLRHHLNLSLEEIIEHLALSGCYPHLSRRGKYLKRQYTWRFHVNGAGNYWAEGSTPRIAARRALKLWEKAGKPMDGYAVLTRKAEDENPS